MTSYREALEVLSKFGKTLQATDFNPDNYVMINHEEGTVLFYASAFLMRWKEWIFVYTEHHGEYAFHKGDLSACHQFKKTEVMPLEGTGHKDKCSDCGTEYPVEALKYSTHPEKWKEQSILCGLCLHTYEE